MTETYFFDIDKSGRDYFGKNDINIITNEQAILESIMNIIATEPGERVMYPDFGCSLRKYLFEPIDEITSGYIRKEIFTSVEKYEPRIERLEVIVEPNEDENSYNINIIFQMKVLKTQKSISFSLDKVR